MIIGIDPGLTGAIALISDDGVEVEDMPVSAKLNGKGKEVNAVGVSEILNRAVTFHDAVVYVEAVGPQPGQGVTGMFSFGRSVGVIEGVVAALSLPVMHISPQRWKKAAGLLGKDKDAARTLAVNLFPQMWEDLARKKDVGRADALCIAYFAAKLCAEKFTHTG